MFLDRYRSLPILLGVGVVLSVRVGALLDMLLLVAPFVGVVLITTLGFLALLPLGLCLVTSSLVGWGVDIHCPLELLGHGGHRGPTLYIIHHYICRWVLSGILLFGLFVDLLGLGRGVSIMEMFDS